MLLASHVITSQLLSQASGIRHGFFTRQGGVSSGPYASLNCGLGSEDHRELVLQNRRLTALHLGAAPDQIVTLHQTHSATALVLDQRPVDGPLPKADAIVTATPGLVVAALSADCTPVLFADPQHKIVAAAHAGWRGAVCGILEATIDAMERLGARRPSIRAAIGPCIHQANYEVGPEFEAQLVNASPGNAHFFTTAAASGRRHFDLPGFVANRLAIAGIADIDLSRHCTYEDPQRFFSYRRGTHQGERDYGRQISAIVLA
jgi:polyphenol oxidase